MKITILTRQKLEKESFFALENQVPGVLAAATFSCPLAYFSSVSLLFNNKIM
jgi:hypothetical protein